MTALPLARASFVLLVPGPARADRPRSRAMAAGMAGQEYSRAVVAVAQKRDRAAFALLFEHFAPRVKSFMLRAGAPPALAEELAQETLLVVWRKAAMYDPARASAAAWIFTIARNLRIDRLRKEWRETVTGDDAMPETVDEGPAPDAELSGVERGARVREAMRRLSAEQMKVLELSFFQEKPHSEIASVLGIPLGTVKSRIRLAMNRLRELLEDLA